MVDSKHLFNLYSIANWFFFNIDVVTEVGGTNARWLEESVEPTIRYEELAECETMGETN